ncbi:MAG TPA: heme-binding domain-containing protein [Roseiflexaceae bacterium]|nr:heme-binding domain-containing protein [Roseiflexaceae bacterium]
MTPPSVSPAVHPLQEARRPGRRPPLRTFAVVALGAAMALFLALQLVPYGREHSNPPVVAEPAWDSEQTRVLFMRACGDCHSNETRWPWYSSVAPVSWLVTRDVTEGRAKLNISEWGRAENEADEAAETVQKGSMPPWFYPPLHPEAQLSAAERQQLIAGLLATFGGHGGEGGEGAREDESSR